MSEAFLEILHRPLNRLLLALSKHHAQAHPAFFYFKLQDRKGLATRFLYGSPDGKK